MTFLQFLRLIRWKNVLLMGYFLVLINWVLFPKLIIGEALETSFFIVFAIAILTIQAGGYVINAIFDLRIDQINKPDAILLTNEKKIEKAGNIYKVLNVIGIGTGIWFSMQIAQQRYSIVFIGAA